MKTIYFLNEIRSHVAVPINPNNSKDVHLRYLMAINTSLWILFLYFS